MFNYKFSTLALKIIATISVLICLLFIGLKSLFIRFIADEYCLAYIAKHKGLWGGLVYWYYSWTGKYSYIFFGTLVKFFGLKIFPFIPIIVLIVWTISLFWTLFEIYKLLNFKIKYSHLIYIMAVILFTHFWSMPSIGQSFYWESSSPYTIPLILLTLNIGIIVRILRSKSYNPIMPFVILTIAFVAGGFSETFVSMQTTVLAVSIFITIKKYHFQNKKTLLIFLIAAFLGSSLSLLIIGIAPGNKMRQAMYPPPDNILIPSLLTFIYSIYYLIRSLGSFAAGLFIVPVASHIPEGLMKALHNKNKFRSIIITITLAVYIVILSCIAPNFFAISRPPFDRNLAIPNFVLIVYSTFMGYVIGSVMTKKNNQIISIVFLMMLIFLSASYSYRIVKTIPYYKVHADRWDRQNRFILVQKNKGIKDITIETLGYTEGLEDVQRDSKHWINICMSQYYGVNSIKAK